MLPPDRCRTSALRARAFDVEIGDDLLGEARHCRPVEEAGAAEGLVAIALGDRILRRRHAGDEACRVPVFRDAPDAELRSHRSRRPGIERPRRTGATCRCAGVSKPLSRSASALWPLPETPASPRISPPWIARVDAIEALRRTTSVKFDLHRAWRLLLGLGLGHRPAHHQFGKLLAVGRRLLAFGDDAARRAAHRCGRSPS